MPTGTTSHAPVAVAVAVRTRPGRRLAAGLFAPGLLAAVLLGLAPSPAHAADDPTRPNWEVTFGPSCGPGVVRIEVTAGTLDYAVTLLTQRAPDGEDSAQIAAGKTVELVSDEVPFGERVDVSLRMAPLNGSAEPAIEPISDYTRPSKEDCDAIAAPSSVPTDPPAVDAAVSPPPGAPGPADPGPGTPTAEGTAAPPVAAGDGSTAASPGDTITLRASGFTPGEQVEVRVHGGGAVLATVTADGDGTAEATVHLPAELRPGSAQLDLVGGSSAAVAEVSLQVGGQAAPAGVAGSRWPLLIAGLALVGGGTAFAVVGSRRLRSSGRGRVSGAGRGR